MSVLIAMALLYSLILSSVIPTTLLFFLNIAEVVQGFLWFHIHFWIICSSSAKYIIGILTGIVLNL